MSLRAWLVHRIFKPTPGVRALCVALCAAPCVAACGTAPPTKIELEVYSWWQRKSEYEAFDDVLSQYELQHPDFHAVNKATNTDADEVRTTLTKRLLAEAAPTTFQANIGADLLRWTVVDTTDPQSGEGIAIDAREVQTSSRLQGLTSFFQQNGLNARFPEVLTKVLAGPNGEPYAVPIDVHRLNVLYYNTVKLDEFSDRNGGKSFLDPVVLCPPNVHALLADRMSKLDVKIALGEKDSFALTLFAFESVLPALAGPELYDDLFHGRASEAQLEGVRPALECVQYLSRSFLDAPGDTWADALSQVKAGRAEFSVMGDWSNGELQMALDDRTVAARPFPGSEHTFVFTSDTFPLPVKAPYPEQTQELLRTIASVDGQRRFSAKKGSIPARSDIDVSVLGPRAVSTRRDFYDDGITKVLATSGLFPSYFPDDKLKRVLSALIQPNPTDTAIEDVIGLLRDTQPLLARWQARIEASQVPHE